MNKVKKIAILTSGGDCPGMNNIISGVYRAVKAVNSEIEVNKQVNGTKLELLLIKNGFKGLLNKEIHEINDNWKQLISLGTKIGGTIIGSSRFKEFQEEEVRRKAKKILEDYGIEVLIGIGGDGTFNGLLKLSDLGVQCIAIPGTIDNDLAASDWTVGFDTALNTVVRNIDSIRETSDSHSRISIVEVMGRYAGDLAILSGVNCDVLSTPEVKIEENELISIVEELHNKQQLKSILVLVTEHLYDVKKLAKKIEDLTKTETRATILGQIQRGGTPSAWDRYLGTMMGEFAVEQANKVDKSSIAVCIQANKLVAITIQSALSTPRTNKVNAINKILSLSGIIAKKK